MTRKYCKVKTADGYPVSVAQVRQLRRNGDWALDSRKADIGTWGRLITGGASITGTEVTMLLTPVTVDLSHYDKIYFGFVCNGTGTATWDVSLSMSGGGVKDITVQLTNPGTAASSTGTCSPGNGPIRTCDPQVIVTRTSGTGSLSMRYIGIWGHHSEDHEYGPQLLQTALAADLLTALDRAKYVLNFPVPLIGWFGAYTMTTGTTAVSQWYELGSKLDDDETLNSVITANATIYENVSAAGKVWRVTHTQNNASTNYDERNSSGTAIYSAVSLPIDAPSYKTTTPWSGGKLDVIAQANEKRPEVRAVMITRSASGAMWDAIKPTYSPGARLQIRTAEAAGAVGINDIATTIHKCTWYAGGNVSGGMSQAGEALSLTSAGYTKAFDGLIWVHNDAQSGATWGTNTYQVAVRCSSSGVTNATLKLTVGGQSATATKAVASGENYLLFEPALSSIDVTKYAVACAVELTVDTSRTITVYSVQISRRGAAY